MRFFSLLTLKQAIDARLLTLLTSKQAIDARLLTLLTSKQAIDARFLIVKTFVLTGNAAHARGFPVFFPRHFSLLCSSFASLLLVAMPS